MKYILTLLLGVLLGGAAAYFLWVGAPRTGALKGQPVRAPDPGGPPPGTAVVELDEQFFGALLDSIFRDLNKPAFPPAAGEGCQNQVVIEPNAGDVKTGVLMREGTVVVPLAFSGTYNLFGNCQNLRGTAEANIDFRFAPDEVTVPVGGAVRWVWSPRNKKPHDVYLAAAPAGIRKGSYSSRRAIKNAEFTRAFRTPGTYDFLCSVHPGMNLEVTVSG